MYFPFIKSYKLAVYITLDDDPTLLQNWKHSIKPIVTLDEAVWRLIPSSDVTLMVLKKKKLLLMAVIIFCHTWIQTAIDDVVADTEGSSWAIFINTWHTNTSCIWRTSVTVKEPFNIPTKNVNILVALWKTSRIKR